MQAGACRLMAALEDAEIPALLSISRELAPLLKSAARRDGLRMGAVGGRSRHLLRAAKIFIGKQRTRVHAHDTSANVFEELSLNPLHLLTNGAFQVLPYAVEPGLMYC